MAEEFELISHNQANYHLFMVQMLYRSPHIHMDYEILLSLSGRVCIHTPRGNTLLNEGDIFILNPMTVHSLEAEAPSLLLSLQIPPSFFTPVSPEICHTEFTVSSPDSSNVKGLKDLLLKLAQAYFSEEKCYALHCASLLYEFSYLLFRDVPNRQLDEKEYRFNEMQGARMRRILEYIDTHYAERITLKGIADKEGLSFYYVSHLFHDHIGISFQSYLAQIRCGHAREILQSTNLSLLEICMECGFSDPKYFNKEFLKIYGSTPKEYRKRFHTAPGSGYRPEDAGSAASIQKILTGKEALNTLLKIRRN